MAEFCKDCFIGIFHPAPDEQLVMSEDCDFCESCNQYKPYVLYVDKAICQVKSKFT